MGFDQGHVGLDKRLPSRAERPKQIHDFIEIHLLFGRIRLVDGDGAGHDELIESPALFRITALGEIAGS